MLASTFKKTLLHTSIITIFTAPVAHFVQAKQTINPENNSNIQLVQTNDSGVDDKHIVNINSKGDGGIILKGLNTTSADKSLVQIILSEYVNRGNETDNLANILDINVNNQNIESQNTFYLTQIGGSWLSMNIDGENNTISISELAGIGFNVEDQNTLKEKPSDDITQISINGNDNSLEITPTIIGNIAKRLNVDLSQNNGTTYANLINIAYSDFADIVVELVDASYSIIDIEQSDSEDFNNENNDLLNNMVYLTIKEADGTLTKITQNGINNQAELSMYGQNNEVNSFQENYSKNGSNIYESNVSGNNNIIEINQTIQKIKNSKDEINLIKIDLVNSKENTIKLFQNSNNRSNKNEIDLTVVGQTNSIDISQTKSNKLTSLISGNQNILSMKKNSNANVNADLDGHLNSIDINGMEYISLYTEIEGDQNNLKIQSLQKTPQYSDLHGDISIRGIANDYIISTNEHIGVSDQINGNNNFVEYKTSGYMHTHNRIYGDENIVIFNSQNSSFDFNYTDVSISIFGKENTILTNNKENEDYHFSDDFYDIDIKGDQNLIDYEKNYSNHYYSRTVIDIDGHRNELSLKPALTENRFNLIGNENVVSIYGQALEAGRAVMYVNGQQNSVEVNVDGLYGDFEFDIVGNNNNMNFNLSAGDITYNLTGSGFTGSINTHNNTYYYQQIEQLGTGTIEMTTEYGIVNVKSNCGQNCNPAT